jgi:hypothetical protein
MTVNQGRPAFVELKFDGGFSERDAWEATQRGYMGHGWVELSDGSRHRVTFIDPVRLAQDLASEEGMGRPFLAEPGLIVLREVTWENMLVAARALAEADFFRDAAMKS